MKKKEGFYGWTALFGAALSGFCVCGVLNSFGDFLPALTRDMGWKRGDVSVAEGLSGMIATLFMPLAGIFIRRYGGRPAILIGNVLIALSLFFLAFLSGYWQLLAAYAVIGLGIGMGGFIAVTTIASNWFIKKSSLAIGIVVGVGNIGGLVLIPAIMMLINRIGWRSVYMVLGAFILLFAAIIPALIVRSKPEDLGQIPDGVPLSSGVTEPACNDCCHTSAIADSFTAMEALKTRSFWLLTIFGCVPLYIIMFFMAHQIAFLTGLGVRSEIAALSAGMIPGLIPLGAFSMGLLGTKFNVKDLAVGAACVMFIAVVISFFTQSNSMAFVYSILLGIGIGASFIAITTLMPIYFGRVNFPKIMGLSVFFSIIANIGAPLGGFLYDMTKSYRPALAVAMVVAAIGIVCALMLRPPLHPSLMKGRESIDEHSSANKV